MTVAYHRRDLRCLPTTSGLLPGYGSRFADPRAALISVRDLLQHTAGWDHRVTGDPLFQRLPDTAASPPQPVQPLRDKADVVRYMLNQSLQYTPGSVERFILSTKKYSC